LVYRIEQWQVSLAIYTVASFGLAALTAAWAYFSSIEKVKSDQICEETTTATSNVRLKPNPPRHEADRARLFYWLLWLYCRISWTFGVFLLFCFTCWLLYKPPALFDAARIESIGQPQSWALSQEPEKARAQTSLLILYSYLESPSSGGTGIAPKGRTFDGFLTLIRSLIEQGIMPKEAGEDLIGKIRDKIAEKAIDKGSEAAFEIAKDWLKKLLGPKEGESKGSPVVNLHVDSCCNTCPSREPSKPPTLHGKPHPKKSNCVKESATEKVIQPQVAMPAEERKNSPEAPK
jgi:hypothetical protein